MDLESLAKLGGAGAVGAALVVTFLFTSGKIVPGYLYRAAVERAEKAEARLWETLPVLRKASETIDRSTDLARQAVESVKNANGNQA